MKLFKLDGTTQNTFSIGVGKNKVEFQSFDGKLYYRNYGKAWIEIKDSEDTLKEWESRRVYTKGQMFTFSNAIWYVKENHTSGDFFSVTQEQVAKVAEYSGLVIFDINSDSQFSITNQDSLKVVFDGLVDLSLNPTKKFILPNAFSFERGNRIEIQNDTNMIIDLYLHDEITKIGAIRPQGLMFALLKNRVSTNGDWLIYDIGAGDEILKFNDSTIVSEYLLEINQLIPVSTAFTDSFIVRLPPTPFNSERVGLLDVGYNLAKEPIVLDGNGKLINGEPAWNIDVNGVYVELIYNINLDSWFFVENPVAGFSGVTTSASGNIGPSEFVYAPGPLTIDVIHNKGYFPMVQIMDFMSNERIEVNWKHINNSILRITLETPRGLRVLVF